jgi:hypothetical protein
MITSTIPMPASGLRVLGMGRLPETALAVQNTLRLLGYRATAFVLTNDPEGDSKLIELLSAERFDGVVIGGYINGQGHEHPASPTSYLWFTRVLNIVTEHAPGAKIILSRKPSEAAEACERVVGKASVS